jgi:hypothetical protein
MDKKKKKKIHGSMDAGIHPSMDDSSFIASYACN